MPLVHQPFPTQSARRLRNEVSRYVQVPYQEGGGWWLETTVWSRAWPVPGCPCWQTVMPTRKAASPGSQSASVENFEYMPFIIGGEMDGSLIFRPAVFEHWHVKAP